MDAIAHADRSYLDLVARLSRASIAKRFDAYTDVPWQAPGASLDRRDPRWELAADDPLGATTWYKAQSQADRARIGLAWAAYRMKRGVEFENILSQGLLAFAVSRPNLSPEFRYAYHELIEEGQHSLMFQEFVNRSGCDVPPSPRVYRFMARRVPALGRRFPELFFVYVLAGEVPIDQTQRQLLRQGDALHPLLRTIMQIHVTEEARHVCFAHKYLAAHLPALSVPRRAQLQWMAPFIVNETVRLMFAPTRSFTREQGIPREVMAELYASRLQRAYVRQAVQPLCQTFRELGLLSRATEPIWQLLGLGRTRSRRKALPSEGLRP